MAIEFARIRLPCYLYPVKGILKFLVGAILGGLVGWALGFLRFPMVESNGSFWTGFLAAMSLVLLLLALVYLGKNRKVLRSKNQRSGNSNRGRLIFVMILAAVSMAIGGAIGSWNGQQSRTDLEARIQEKDQAILEQEELMESVRQEQLAALMSNVLGKIDEELATNPDSLLTTSTIARVTALSYSFKPYRSLSGDTLAHKKLSPERGQLLLALASMDIDSTSFALIKKDASFAEADLREANLKGADLSGADLKGANLRDAVLDGANLQQANLEWAMLWGAKLDSANLSEANLRWADLKWTEMNGANLSRTAMNGADLSDAKMRSVEIKGAVFQFGKANNAMLIDADLSGTDMFGTKLINANLTNANLFEANVIAGDLTDARITGANLLNLSCHPEMMDRLIEWRIPEAAEIKATFKVVLDSINPYPSTAFCLEKINP